MPMSRALLCVPAGTGVFSYAYETAISRTPHGTSTGRYTKSGDPAGRVPRTVLVRSVPSLPRFGAVASAKLTVPNVRAVAAVPTRRPRLAIGWP
ncbi:hypothetical protein SAMN02787144_102199 [Streptomyces atratus]|uniref:Uncharacterized protein n=1 Tax=Streptomyces atratus TaxID=1893 RepID=A0A1K2ERL9_STRAR|nr:hypothetical protein SAMN02787144_102199 [Streptomyces atratus]